jgi:hypothetical protein
MDSPLPDWLRLMTEERDMLLLGAFILEENANMTAKMAVNTLVSNVSRGGLVIYCERAGIPLPNTAYGRRYYTRLRRDTKRGRGRLATLYKRFGDRTHH